MTGNDDSRTGQGVAASSRPSLEGFVRARLAELADTADDYHRDGCCSLPPPAGYNGPFPCDCDEPNRRRRRAFTHGNLVDWAERAANATGTMTVDDMGQNHDPEDVLLFLAAEWSDHPDYQTGWAP